MLPPVWVCLRKVRLEAAPADRFVASGMRSVCDDCLAAFPVLPARVCGKCGSPSVPETLVAAGSNLSATVGETPGADWYVANESGGRAFESARSYATFRGYWFE